MEGSSWSRFVPDEGDLSFCTDLYQLTMAAAYHRRGGASRGAFELTVRRLPPRRNFLVFAGLEQALVALEALRFSEQQTSFLRSLPAFAAVEASFFERLRSLTFTADVWAMEEGTVFFPDEPVLRVCGDLIEAQIVETLLLSIINFQTSIASKAARIRLAAGDDLQLAEFGTRRAHGPQAAMWAARAAYLAGFDSTSNLLAGQQLDIPVVGTMAHSFVMSSSGERQAFLDYHRVFPEAAVFLVDTYDTLRGVERALDLGVPFHGIRLDSGDLAALAARARQMLDQGGRRDATIFASGDVDESVIGDLRRAGAPIDAYGIGSKLATSADAPYTGGVYKLVEVSDDGDDRPTFKESSGKSTYPGRKQVLRRRRGGVLEGDTLILASDRRQHQGEAMLRPVMVGGERVAEVSLGRARRCARRNLAALPEDLRAIDRIVDPYPVQVDQGIEDLLERGRRVLSVPE